MRLRIIIAVAMLATGCSREPPPNPVGKASENAGRPAEAERVLKIGWDPPPVPAARYQVFVDDRMVKEILPPPVDAACQCLLVSVSVPPGAHVVKVVAHSAEGKASTPATLTVQ
jgi:hypothetical protein